MRSAASGPTSRHSWWRWRSSRRCPGSPSGSSSVLPPRPLRFALAVLLLGVACGLGGAGFTVLLEAVERLVFGLTTGTVVEAAVLAPAARRSLVVAASGCVVASCWWALRKWGPAVPSVADDMRGSESPVFWTVADTALQVVNVGAGGSIGREGAPRQFGAMAAGFCARLAPDQRRILVACGAGAGLASIYDVPIGGACFALECVVGLAALRTMRPAAMLTLALAALASSSLATIVARIAVPAGPIYAVPPHAVPFWASGPSLILFALLCGPFFGAAGLGFSAAFEALARRAPKGRAILWAMPLAYLCLAALAVPFPLVLGNGHALALHVLAGGGLPTAIAAALLFAKPLATFLTVGSGATGGKLTPSLSTGAVLGAVLATAWSAFWPVPVTGAAILGAGAVLAAATDAPLTAAILMAEFTGADPAAWPGLTIAALGAFLTARLLRRHA